jgi:hypothetical protein
MRTTFLGFLLWLATVSGAVCQDAAKPIAAANQECTPDKEWSAQERFVWARACHGQIADFNSEPDYGGYLDPKKPEWPDSRILRSKFLEAVLLKEKYRAALTRDGLRIIGARFTESIDLANAELRITSGWQCH